MRLDIVLLITLVALIALGYLASDDIRLRQELAQAMDVETNLRNQVQDLGDKLAAEQQVNQDLTGKVTDLTQQITDLDAQLAAGQQVNQDLTGKVTDLTQQVTVLQNRLALASQPVECPAASDTASQVSASGKTGGSMATAPVWAIPLSMVPVAGLALLDNRRRAARRGADRQERYVLLTDQERKWIIENRRKN